MIDAFWSDQHFGHGRIIEYSERPFSSLEEMHETMIRNFNEVVGPSDTCLWGGDCFMGGVDGREILSRLNGTQVLVLGNHDRSAARMFELGFTVVAEEMFLRMAGRNVRVKHYPYWYDPPKDEEGNPLDRHGRPIRPKKLKLMRSVAPPRVKGEVLLHGHTHSSKKRKDNMVHIGVDAWGYRPATWKEVEEIVATI